MQKRCMTEIETADYLGVSRSTLRQGRMNGPRENRIMTPPFVKAGRKVIYLRDHLDTWLEDNRQAA